MNGLQLLTHDEARKLIEANQDVALFVIAKPGAVDPPGESQTVLEMPDVEPAPVSSFPDWLEAQGVKNHGHIASAVRYSLEIKRGTFGSPAPTVRALIGWYDRMTVRGLHEAAAVYSTLPGSPVVPYALALVLVIESPNEADAVKWLEEMGETGRGAVEVLGENPWATMSRTERAEKILKSWDAHLERNR